MEQMKEMIFFRFSHYCYCHSAYHRRCCCFFLGSICTCGILWCSSSFLLPDNVQVEA